MQKHATHSRCSGFTLIELVTVMVVFAIVATLGTGFVVSTLESYSDTQARAKLINRSRQAIERITRQLRSAAPSSMRVTNGGDCIEFLPVAGGGNYLNPVPDADNGAPGSNSIATAPFSVDFWSADYVTIGAGSAADIYGGGSLAALASSTSTSLTLTANKVWDRNSPTRRFFLTDDPQAFCISGTELRFYDGYATPLTTTGIPGGAGVLMAQNVSSAAPFAIDSGTEVRGPWCWLTCCLARAVNRCRLVRRYLFAMCPDKSFTTRCSAPALAARQRGFLMPLAIFILVIMGFFVATLSRTTTQTALSATQEGVTLQAFYAAESGAQLGMNNLFYDSVNSLTRLAVDGRCNSLSLSQNFSATGLGNCSATVSCSCSYENGTACDTGDAGNYNGANGIASSFYTLNSLGQCGPAGFDASRTIQVSARMD